MKHLVEDHERAAKNVTYLRFKGKFLSLEFEVAHLSEIIEDKEKLIEKTVNKNWNNQVPISSSWGFKLQVKRLSLSHVS